MATLALHVMQLAFLLLEAVQYCKLILRPILQYAFASCTQHVAFLQLLPCCISEEYLFYLHHSLFQPSADTILQETVQREAYNGVYDINIIKVVTPAVLVGVCVCMCVSLFVCVCMCVYLFVCVCVCISRGTNTN